MQVSVSIGENHRFELREALLIYRDQQRSFVTRHEVSLPEKAPPTLGPAQPLTRSFLQSLSRSMNGSFKPEFLPTNVLAKGDRMITWWTPPQRRQMFFQEAQGRLAALDGRSFPQPALVWLVEDGDLKIRALPDAARPEAQTTLAVAPFWNLSEDGRVCTGSMRRPDAATVAAMPGWEQGFYESAFTHANVGRLTKHEGGFEGLWTELAGSRKRFPSDTLIQIPQTLAAFLNGERGQHAYRA